MLNHNKRRSRRRQGAVVACAKPVSPMRTEWIILFATALLLSLAGLLAFSSRALAHQGTSQRAVAVAQVVTDTTTMTDTNAITGAAELTATDAITSPEAMTDTMGMTDTVLLQSEERTLTRADFDRIFLSTISQIAARQGVALNEDTVLLFENLRPLLLTQLANQEALLAEAEARGIEVSDEEIETIISDLQSNLGNEQAFRQALRDAGFADEAALRQSITDQLRLRQLLDELRQEITVSDDDIQRFYDENQERFTTPQGTVALEAVRDRIRRLLVNEQLNERLAELRTEYGIEVFPGNLAPFAMYMAVPISEDGATGEAGTEEGAEATTSIAPLVTVYDQYIRLLDPVGDQGIVVVARVYSDGPGWIVIHADENGGPGPVLGYSYVEDGYNPEVPVRIELADVTETLYAMLHVDAGEEGVYEFPGPDQPVMDPQELLVSPPFHIIGTRVITGTDNLSPTQMLTGTGVITGTELLTATDSMTDTGTTGAEEGQTIQAGLTEFAINMEATEVPAGPTTFAVTNAGSLTHNFAIEGQGVEAMFEEDLQPGQSDTLTVDLPPGEYTVYCPVGNHRARGMEMSLTVTE